MVSAERGNTRTMTPIEPQIKAAEAIITYPDSEDLEASLDKSQHPPLCFQPIMVLDVGLNIFHFKAELFNF